MPEALEVTMRLVATLKDNPTTNETTHSHEWWFTEDAEYSYADGMVVVEDQDNPGNLMRPKVLIIPMRNYDEVKVIEKE
jgi:hypothetical protein